MNVYELDFEAFINKYQLKTIYPNYTIEEIIKIIIKAFNQPTNAYNLANLILRINKTSVPELESTLRKDTVCWASYLFEYRNYGTNQ